MKCIIDSHMAKKENGGEYFNAIQALGYDIIVVDYSPFMNLPDIPIDPNERYLAIGSLLFIRDITKTFGNVIAFNGGGAFLFSEYASHVDQSLLLSKNRMLSTIGRMKDSAHISQLRLLFGDKVFIRPNRWDKPFAGQVIDISDPIQLNGFLSMNRSLESEIIIIDRAVDIEVEYRLYVSRDNGIITGSSYDYIERGKESRERIPEEVKEVANRVMKSFGYNIPDEMIVIDVAGVKNGNDIAYYLVEINAVSTSGPYDSDCKSIIKEMIAIM